jgi:hypothetical protein
MKLRTRVILQLAALCVALAANGFAADNAYLYIVNGAPGRDVATNLNPGFPVDILINGVCQSHGLAYDSTDGPLSFAAGTYTVQISEANTLAPCTNAAIIDSTVTLTSGDSTSAVISVSTGQPTLLQFSDALSAISAGDARFVFANAADAAELQVTLTQTGVTNPKTFTMTANSGAEATLTVADGSYSVQVVASGSTTVLATESVTLASQSAIFVYATGESSNSSIGLVNKTVLDVF